MAVVDINGACGQSNWAGPGSYAESPDVDPALCWEWRSGLLVPLADPVASGESPYNANTGSPHPAFSGAFTTASLRPLVTVPCAVGGTALVSGASSTGWWVGGSRYTDAVTRINDAISDTIGEGHTIGDVFITWHQGERDAQSGVSQIAYQTALIDLLARFRIDLSRPTLRLYVCRMGEIPTYETETAAIRAAQDAACAATEGLVMSYTRCVDFFTLGWMKVDGLHYNQIGLNDMGSLAGAVAAADLGHSDPLPPVVPNVPRTSLTGERLLGIA